MKCSPSAMTLTSLSTTTTAPSSARTKPGTSKPSQPGMIGGLVGRPVACSTGPGSPMPTPARSAGSRPVAAHEPAAVLDDPAQHGVGTEGDVEVDELAASTVAARSVTASRTWVAPTSAASTTRAAGLKANCVGGRPPVDVASPAGPTSALASRASTRWATVERPSPVTAASSLRVRGHAVAEVLQQGSGTVHGASETHRTSVWPEQLLLDIRQKCRMVGDREGRRWGDQGEAWPGLARAGPTKETRRHENLAHEDGGRHAGAGRPHAGRRLRRRRRRRRRRTDAPAAGAPTAPAAGTDAPAAGDRGAGRRRTHRRGRPAAAAATTSSASATRSPATAGGRR